MWKRTIGRKKLGRINIVWDALAAAGIDLDEPIQISIISGKVIIETIDDMTDYVCDEDCEGCPLDELDCDGDCECECCPCYAVCEEGEMM